MAAVSVYFSKNSATSCSQEAKRKVNKIRDGNKTVLKNLGGLIVYPLFIKQYYESQ